MNLPTEARDFLEKLHRQTPLVLNVTNLVAMDLSANALLAVGASPLMAQSLDEIDDLVALSGALVVNGGTLDERWIALAHRACDAANAAHKPVVLDPVGAGASRLRTETFRDFLERHRPAVVRGNASEILALAGATAATRGVDATQAVEESIPSARTLAARHRTTVVVSGPVDYVTDGKDERRVVGGHPWMTRVTAMGCTASAIVGAALAVLPKPIDAGTAAMQVMAAAGERAGASDGPGSFRVAFLDALFAMGNAR